MINRKLSRWLKIYQRTKCNFLTTVRDCSTSFMRRRFYNSEFFGACTSMVGYWVAYTTGRARTNCGSCHLYYCRPGSLNEREDYRLRHGKDYANLPANFAQLDPCYSVGSERAPNVYASFKDCVGSYGTSGFRSLIIGLGWRRGSVVRTSVFNWRTFPDLRPMWLTCDHLVGKVSAMGQSTRSAEPSISSGSVNE